MTGLCKRSVLVAALCAAAVAPRDAAAADEPQPGARAKDVWYGWMNLTVDAAVAGAFVAMLIDGLAVAREPAAVTPP